MATRRACRVLSSQRAAELARARWARDQQRVRLSELNLLRWRHTPERRKRLIIKTMHVGRELAALREAQRKLKILGRLMRMARVDLQVREVAAFLGCSTRHVAGSLLPSLTCSSHRRVDDDFVPFFSRAALEARCSEIKAEHEKACAVAGVGRVKQSPEKMARVSQAAERLNLMFKLISDLKPEDGLLTRSQIAERLGVSYSKVYFSLLPNSSRAVRRYAERVWFPQQPRPYKRLVSPEEVAERLKVVSDWISLHESQQRSLRKALAALRKAEAKRAQRVRRKGTKVPGVVSQ